MQARGRFVEQEQLARMRRVERALRRVTLVAGLGCFGQMPGQLEALGLAARERGHRLPEPQVFEADIGQRLQHALDFGVVAEELDRFRHREFEHIGDRLVAHDDFQHLAAEALAVAVRAAQVDVGEELHLHVLEAVAAAGGAAAVAGVEAERAGRIAALLRRIRLRVDVADRVPGADVARGVGARGLADGRLVDHDHLGHVLGATQFAVLAGHFGRLALGLQQRGVQNVVDERGLARSRDAGHAHQALQRDRDVDVLEVVLFGAEDLEARRGWQHARAAFGPDRLAGALAPGEVLGGQRLGLPQFGGRAEEHDLAAALAGARAHVHDPVGLEHDLRVVLDDDERVARVAQALHHVDDAAHVARVQADGGLVQHEERIDERGAQRRGQVDALDLAARQRARLAVERQVAQAHGIEEAQPRADLGDEQFCGLIQRCGQLQRLHKIAERVDGHQHQVVDRPLAGLELVEQGVGLQACAVAGRAGRVRAVLREQHADVHLVRLALQPVEEAPHPVPDAGPGGLPVHPLGLAFQHPVAVLVLYLAPGGVERDAALLGVLLDVGLAFLEAGRLPRADRAVAQALRLVRDDQAEVDADHAAKAPAGVAGAKRRVEREQARHRLAVVEVAVRAVQVRGVAPD